jgi:hypothetical protein
MEHLEENGLKTLESMKATYLQKALRISRYILWLVYVLTRKSLLIEDLCYKLLLPSIKAANKLIIQRRKKNEIWIEHCSMEDVVNRKWTNRRHLIMHMTMHGFDHKIYQTEGFHSPNKNCQS